MTPAELRTQLKAIGATGKPVIVGPWLSEVGFELLYWIPFLRWAVEVAQVPRERLFVLSRGGCRSWYADISANYLDLYDTATPSDISALNERRIRQQSREGARIGLRMRQRTAKQLYQSSIETDLIADVTKRVGLSSPVVLHPSLLYNAFRPVWRKHRKRELIPRWQEMTRLKPIQPPATEKLFARYVAVKFYASQACPDTAYRVRDVQTIVRALAETTDVVLLHTGTAYDEHGEFHVPMHPRVHVPVFEPTRNLDQQTAIIAGADAFVGTYGGFAYLAPFLGVATIACYGIDNFRHDHLGLMSMVASRLHASFRVCALGAGAEVIRGERSRWAHAA